MLGGTANATATAIGGKGSDGFGVFNPPANGGAASANASVTAMLGGTANATATAMGGNGGFGPTPGIAGTANANSFATTINGYAAQANSTATGLGGGQAQATAQTNFGNFQSVQSTSTSPLPVSPAPSTGASASAIAQAGGAVSPSNPIIPGQSFSVVSGSGFGPLTVANGSMGAGNDGRFTNGRSPIRKALVSHRKAAPLCLTCFPATRSESASTMRYFKSL